MYTKKFSICTISRNAYATFSFDKTNLTIESKNRKFIGMVASNKPNKHSFPLKDVTDIEVKKETSIGEIFLGTLIAVASLSILLTGISSLVMRSRLAESMNSMLSMYSNGMVNVVASNYGIISLFFILVFFAAFTSVLLLFGIAIVLNATKVCLSFKANGVESAIYVSSSEYARLEQFTDKLIESKK